MNDPNTEKQGPSVPNNLKSIEEAFLSGAISNNNGDFPNNNTKGGEEEFIERISSNDDFLRLLRADGNFEEQNADTLPTGNGEHHKQKRSSTTASPGGGGGGGDGGGADLFLLFDPPPPVVVAPKNNDYLSNNSSSGLLPPPILNLPTTTTTTTTSKSSSPTKILRRPLPIDRRKRSVSFDTRTNPIIPAMDHLRQPNLEEPSSETTPTISVKVDTDHHHHDDRKLTIDDLLGSGPYELEAQTHILKALEEHQETQTNISPGHYRYRSETSTIFSGVPENVVHDFSLKDDCNDDDALKGQDSMGGGSAGDHGDRPGVIEQTKPLLKRVASSQQRYHRRTMTVEDRLAGLTFAMQNLGDDEGMGSENNNIMLETLNEGTAVEHLSHTAALITGNIDVHNAGSLSPKPRPRLATAGSVASLFRKSPGVDGSLSPRPRPRLATAGSVASIFRKSSGDNDHSSLDAPSGDMEEQLPPQGEPPISSAPTNQKKSRVSRVSNNIFTDRLKEEWDTWKSFFSPRRQHVRKYIRSVIFYLLVPLVGVAAILFYCGGNPRTGKSSGDDAGERASVSWWLLFAVRQVITFSLALALQSIIIDFFCIGTRVMLRILGPLLTLLLAQSKGWPFVVFWWAVFDFAMLCGDLPFAQHWGYWQDYVALFNETNPSGQVVYSVWNYRVLTIAMIVSLAVSLKRFVIGLYLGRQTFGHYGEPLAALMNKMLLVGEVSQLARKFKRASAPPFVVTQSKSSNFFKTESFSAIPSSPSVSESDRDSSSISKNNDTRGEDENTIGINNLLMQSEKTKLLKLLESWEEPNRQAAGTNVSVSISAVLRFRNALTYIKNEYPFTFAFGPAYSRECCIESAQQVYKSLLMKTPDEKSLHFDTLALLALDDSGEIDERKAKDLIKIFRPDREGVLTLLDFLKSVDSVYKEFRLLQASIENSSQIDKGFENLFNIVFYAVVVTIILSVLGVDPLSLFISLSSVVLAFAFMIGSAAAKYFEGVLFILVRRPYGIGDIIHVSNVQETLSVDGSIGWIVQSVSLFETTCTWVPTLERASLSNGSLANSRIINWARSPNARFNILLTFPIETKYETIEIFKRAVQEYIKVRPREWLSMNGFRVTRIQTEQGFMQLMLTIQHRDPWQNVGQVLDSKANLVSYCNEVQKKLGMQYRAPPMPIDLTNSHAVESAIESLSHSSQSTRDNGIDEEDQFQQFRLIAQSKHNIRMS